ncbi:hypothetical protein HGRIS_002378 [Hohenbuehelia grisea]|uniref:DUF218 domain-containing protein n=1 Tax=Hohenbuehelia grisea TaxID=104357 RepID=A0ABR3JLI5_9AGAR
MLPTARSRNGRPVYQRNVHLSFHGSLAPQRRILDILRTRSRVTNLGLFFLLAITCLSLLLNLSYYISASFSSLRLGSSLSYDYDHDIPGDILSTLAPSEELEALSHLVIVPGHSIWHGSDAASRLNEDDWVLEPYQKGGGRVAAFFEHITKGVEILHQDPKALLIFSGGQTRLSSTTTEAESYMRLALKANLFKLPAGAAHSPRATTEDFALDSFQNLLFSIARFHEYTGRYPENITVVGYEMKRERFTKLHRAALRWPIERFHYVGADPGGQEGVEAQQGERKNGFLPYTSDYYGCHSFLLAKRRQRNPFRRYHPYHTSAAELKTLFDWCPDQNKLFTGRLPWYG